MLALLLIYTIGTLTDYWTTLWGLARGGVERNPFAASLVAEHGIEALLHTKLIAIVILALSMWFMKWLDRKLTELWGEPCRIAYWLAFGSIWLLVLTQWLIVAHNLWEMRIAIALGY